MRELIERIRAICLAFPEVTERPSHGTPTFFVRDKKAFVYAWISGHENRCVSGSENARNFAGTSASRHGRSATTSSRRSGSTALTLENEKTPRCAGLPRGTATGIRTPVSAVRGRRPSPLDDSGR